MHITIDTSKPLSDQDREVLALLAGGISLPVQGEFVSEPDGKPEEPEKVAPAKKAVKKAEPEPTPEPMAEEPLKEPEVEEEDNAEEPQSDEELLALAVKKATEMVAGGQAPQVREALDAAGASRVRELNKDNVRDFFKALT